MSYTLHFTKRAQKDAKKIGRSHLQKQVEQLFAILREDPLRPPCEALLGNLAGTYPRRINAQHRLVYEVDEAERGVKILMMWGHYND